MNNFINNILSDRSTFLQKKDMSIYSKKDNIFIFNEDNLNLTLTAPAWELAFEQYDIEILDINYCYFFNSGLGLFDYYIDKWYNEKRKAEEEKNPIMRQISKLYLNNLGGKFGTSVTGNTGIPCIDEENNTITVNDLYEWLMEIGSNHLLDDFKPHQIKAIIEMMLKKENKLPQDDTEMANWVRKNEDQLIENLARATGAYFMPREEFPQKQ